MQQLWTKVKQSLDQEITQGHKNLQKMVGEFGTMGISIINACRQQGFLLLERKEGTPHGEWLRLFNSKTSQCVAFGFDIRTAQRYMAIAKRYPHTITNELEAMTASAEMWGHTLPSPNGHGPQQLHQGDFFTTAGQKLMSFSDLWEKQMKINPVTQWDTHTAQEFVDQMEPVVNRINTIYSQAKERASIPA